MLKFLLLTCLAAGPMVAQGVPPTQSMDAAALHAKGDELLTKARAAKDGIAFEILLSRPDSVLQMAVRVKSGQAEWHKNDADLLMVLEGNAQITTGGEVINGKDTAPGEIRGEGIRGGKTQPFKAGDVIRIEPQVPHQVLVTPGSTLRYFAVKTKVAKP